MGCHWNVTTLDVIIWHLFWSKKRSKFYGNVMTFWWNSTGFSWEKGIPVKCHENVMKFQCHSMGFKFWFILMVFLWKKSMVLSWNLTSFSTKTPMGINDGILLWGSSRIYRFISESQLKMFSFKTPNLNIIYTEGRPSKL